MRHVPVLAAETTRLLETGGRPWIDATAGAGGHLEKMLEAAGPGARALAVDRNRATLEAAAARLGDKAAGVTWRQGNFRRLAQLCAGVLEPGEAGAILYDLGLSRFLLEESGLGFSFRRPEEPLDMRFDPGDGTRPAHRLLAECPEEELAGIFFRYGEIRQSRALARRIARARERERLETVGQLLGALRGALPRRGGRHPATRVFQALRIAVNDELGALAESLEQAVGILCPGGRLAVISYHSLEDRMVKHFMRDHPELEPVTRKPVRAGAGERAENPASRSALLRVAEKRPEGGGMER